MVQQWQRHDDLLFVKMYQCRVPECHHRTNDKGTLLWTIVCKCVWFAPSIVGNCLQLGVAPSTVADSRKCLQLGVAPSTVADSRKNFCCKSKKKIAILHLGSEY